MNATAPTEAYALPDALDAEMALLGAILIANDALHSVSGFLKAEHFVEPLHGRIFELCAAAIGEGRKATAITLAPLLPPDLRVGDYTPLGYLAHLTAAATSTSNAPDYARVIAETALRRSGMDLAGLLTMGMADQASGGTIRDQFADVELRLLQLSEEAVLVEQDAAPPADFAAVIDDAEARMISGNHLKGVTSGLASVDYRLGGFAPGELILIGARPSMGKSMIALSMARRMARIGIGVGFDSLEMSEQQVRIRLVSDECESMGHKIPYSLAIKGKIEPGQVAAMRRAGLVLAGAPLCIIDRGNRLGDLPGHVRRARKECEAKGAALSVFFVDYLGLVSPGDRYRGQRVQEVTEISAALKAMAKREKIAIVALHQLNRANENREDRRPRLSELRESGALEQDADIVLFVHREAYYLERPGYGADKDDPESTQRLLDCEHVLELIVAKQRQGPICTVKLWADMSMNAVRDAA